MVSSIVHEMAIAEGILDIAFDYAEKNNSKKINKITLQIGEMSGVEIEALNMEAISKSSLGKNINRAMEMKNYLY